MMLLFWIFVVYGTTQILCESTLFKPLRDYLLRRPITKILGTFLTCIICISTWVSFIYSSIWWSPTEWFGYPLIINTVNASFFIDGMFGSCCIWFVHLFERLISAFIKMLLHELE